MITNKMFPWNDPKKQNMKKHFPRCLWFFLHYLCGYKILSLPKFGMSVAEKLQLKSKCVPEMPWACRPQYIFRSAFNDAITLCNNFFQNRWKHLVLILQWWTITSWNHLCCGTVNCWQWRQTLSQFNKNALSQLAMNHFWQ